MTLKYSTLEEMLDKLTGIAQTADTTITRDMVECWVGNQGYAEIQYNWMKNTIDELEAGEYTAQELAEDIIQLCQD